MDATYKTNKLDLPLLHFVGVTATNQTFTAGFAFLQDEQEHTILLAVQDFARLVVSDVLEMSELSLSPANTEV